MRITLISDEVLPLGKDGVMVEVPAKTEISVSQELGNRLIGSGVVLEIIERTEKHEVVGKRNHTGTVKEHKVPK